jgi:STE24 endopeptidase
MTIAQQTQLFLAIFLACFMVRFVLERWLTVLNGRYVRDQEGRIPEALADSISEENHARSIDYTLARMRFDHVEASLGVVLLLIYLFSGLIPWLQAQVAVILPGELASGVALIVVFTLISAFLGLPLEMYEAFILEAQFGFNTMTVGTFWTDKLKEFLLFVVIGVPFLFALLMVMTMTGPLWWLWSALFVIAFEFLVMTLYPLVIAPLFNEFTPLQEGPLKTALEELARKCRFAIRGVFVMDSSTRSTHSNAYFTGFGKSRRIVLFDTLIEELTVSEITAVLSHEIGHYKKRHNLKMLGVSSLLTLSGFLVLKLLIDWKPLYQAFGIPTPTVGAAVLLFGLIGGTFVFWLIPLLNMLSRRHEYEADAYALEQTGGPEAIQSALVKLFKKNLSALSPHPYYSAYHYSHPEPLERLRMLSGRKVDTAA